MGLTQGSILRVFFLWCVCRGSGHAIWRDFGVLVRVYIDPIFSFINYFSGGGVWDPSIRGIYNLPAQLHARDVLSAVVFSLVLSFGVTYFPAPPRGAG